MTPTTIRLTVSEDLKHILETLKEKFPLLNEPELIRWAISKCYKDLEQEEEQRKAQQEATLSEEKFILAKKVYQ